MTLSLWALLWQVRPAKSSPLALKDFQPLSLDLSSPSTYGCQETTHSANCINAFQPGETTSFLTQETCQRSPVSEEDVNMLMNTLIQPVGNSNVLERGFEAAGHRFWGEVPAQADSFVLFFQRSHKSGILNLLFIQLIFLQISQNEKGFGVFITNVIINIFETVS